MRSRKNCSKYQELFLGAAKGGTGNVLFLATTFRKLAKNLIFLLHFYQKISKFSQNFPTICVFRPNARKSNAWFVKFCWKFAQVMYFKQILKEFFWKFSNISHIFRTMYIFVQRREKLAHCLLKILEKEAKIIDFLQFS